MAAACLSDGLGPVSPGTFASISAGSRQTCALLGDGSPYCWGTNALLQLGTGNVNERDSLPRPVAGGLSFVAITTGLFHSCAITASGKAYCWGASNTGALGADTIVRTAIPVPVAGALAFREIHAGPDLTCGLTTTGAAYCWGNDVSGRLGRDTTAARSPLPVSGGHVFTAIAVGERAVCGIAVGGDAYCWGDNALGTLGTGDTTAGKHPTPGLVSGGMHFRSVAVGTDHACAITTSGVAYCWGGNFLGQLGDGSSSDRRVPWPVLTNLTFSSVSAGAHHSCALSDTGDLYCWGWNATAQLGGEANALCGVFTPCAMRPVVAADGRIFRAVSGGGAHTCAIERNGGGAFCWGGNDQGQVGLGSVTDTVTAPSHITDP